jgi:hypothetical protein
MSQAPVGQRSAHRPQCRQTSSSLTMTRPVLSGVLTRTDPVPCARGCFQAGAQVGLFAIAGEGDAVHGTDVHAGIAFDAGFPVENGLHVAVQAAAGFLEGGGGIEAQFHLDA